ncbi:MAG: cytochrome c [Planctomycetes bacterium]|nr:cytochrome c [Planctomycetota bacterium]
MNRFLPLILAFLTAACGTISLLAFPQEVAAQAAPAAADQKHAGLDPYKANCASCHAIGGGKTVGPDLKGLKDRVPSRDWVVQFVKDPAGMIAKDAYAKELRAAYPMDMPGQPSLPDNTLADIIDFIFAGGPGLAQKALRAATEADVEIGRQLFTGEKMLAGGGPACVSCHSIAGLGGLGGGTLAAGVGAMNPDLTHAFTRNGGEAGVRAALSSPQFLVMKQVFADKPMSEDEIVALTAYLGERSRQPRQDQNRDYFIVYGVIGAVLLLLLLDLVWIRRFRNVRKTLVGESQ